MIDIYGVPKGIRTPVTAVRGDRWARQGEKATARGIGDLRTGLYPMRPTADRARALENGEGA